MRARLDQDRRRPKRYGLGIIRRSQQNLRAEGRVGQRVVDVSGKLFVLVAYRRLDSLALRRAGVGEIAKAGDDARHAQNVVEIRRAIDAGAPVEAPRQQLRQARLAAQARLDRMRNHLLERRIGDEKIVDEAGLVRIGAAKLQRRRRAIGLGVIGVAGDFRRELVARADRRIEMGVHGVAVERGSHEIVKADRRIIEAPAGGDGELVGDIQRIETVNAEIAIGGVEMDGLHVGGRVDVQHAEAGDREIAGIEHADLLVGREIGPAVFVVHAESELVGQRENLVGVLDLHRAAQRARARPGAVDDAEIGRALENIGQISRIAVAVAQRRARRRSSARSYCRRHAPDRRRGNADRSGFSNSAPA